MFLPSRGRESLVLDDVRDASPCWRRHVGIIYGASVVVVDARELDDTAELDGAGVAGTTGSDGAAAGAAGRELTTLDCRYTSHPTTVPTGAS